MNGPQFQEFVGVKPHLIDPLLIVQQLASPFELLALKPPAGGQHTIWTTEVVENVLRTIPLRSGTGMGEDLYLFLGMPDDQLQCFHLNLMGIVDHHTIVHLACCPQIKRDVVHFEVNESFRCLTL